MTLNKAVADIRARQRIKPSALDRPSAVWTGVDLLDGREIKTLTIIFKTSGCRWGQAGGCTMCVFVDDSATEPPSPADLETQLDRALNKADDMDEFMLKIFTSGSFFDEREISPQVRQSILRRLADDERIPKVLAETRPEYVTDEIMDECTTILGDTKFEIAVGLDLTNSQFFWGVEGKEVYYTVPAKSGNGCSSARRSGYDRAYAIAPFISGIPSWAITAPSLKETMEWITLWG